MDIRSLYRTCHGKNFDQLKDYLNKFVQSNPHSLVNLIINTHYNSFIERYSSFDIDENLIDKTIAGGKAYGKRVPYIGWYWRNVDFVNKSISIGNCGDYIGVMENNKWDYPERLLTENECDQVINIIDEAIIKSQEGGNVKSIRDNTVETLEKLWPLFQTFKI